MKIVIDRLPRLLEAVTSGRGRLEALTPELVRFLREDPDRARLVSDKTPIKMLHDRILVRTRGPAEASAAAKLAISAFCMRSTGVGVAGARRGSPATRVRLTPLKSAPERLATMAAPSSVIRQASPRPRASMRYSARQASPAVA